MSLKKITLKAMNFNEPIPIKKGGGGGVFVFKFKWKPGKKKTCFNE